MNIQEKMPQRENKMGVMPVRRLLVTMSLPMMISMLVQALYNVVDSIFVSQYSEAAFKAVSLAFPLQNLMIAIGVGTAVGINALLSRNLGEKDFEGANSAASNGVFLALISTAVFMLIGIFFSRTFFELQTMDAEIIEYGVSYLSICMIFSVGVFTSITFERLLQSTGKTVLSMISQAAGAVTNIILDPILIFGWLGFPAMGVAGAAIATIVGQMVGMCLGLYFNMAKNKEIHIAIKGFRPRAATIKKIYAVGVPSIIMQSIGSVMTFGMNKILMGLDATATAVAVFGGYFKLQSFVFMPVFGLNHGLVPIVAYNYGARKRERMTQAIRLAIVLAMAIMFAGFLIFQFFPAQLLLMFNASEQMLAFGVPALRIISVSFLVAGFSIITGTVLQALGHGVLSLITTVTRQLVVLLPVAFLLSLSGDINLVWWSFPIAEVFSLALSAFFLRHIYHRVIKPLEPYPEPEGLSKG